MRKGERMKEKKRKEEEEEKKKKRKGKERESMPINTFGETVELKVILQ